LRDQAVWQRKQFGSAGDLAAKTALNILGIPVDVGEWGTVGFVHVECDLHHDVEFSQVLRLGHDG